MVKTVIETPKITQIGGTYQTTTEDSQEPASTSGTLPFTKEHRYKPFSPKITVDPSCSLAQRGTSFTTALFTQNSKNPWIIDFGAIDHMTDCSNMFSSYSPCAGNKKIRIADGTLSPIAEIGSIPWVYLMKEKSEVGMIFENFFSMI